MARTALAMMLSLVLLVFVTPSALAKANSKQTSQKNAAAKTPAGKHAAQPAARPAAKNRGRVAPLVAEERLESRVVRGRRGRHVVYQRVAPMPVVPVVPPVMTAGDL